MTPITRQDILAHQAVVPGPRRNARITSSKIRLGDEKI